MLLLTVASIGNIAGSAVNWGLGRGVARLPAPALVSCIGPGAGPRRALVPALGTMVAAAQLGACDRRSADGRRRCAEGAVAAVPGTRGGGEGGTLPGDRGSHPRPSLARLSVPEDGVEQQLHVQPDDHRRDRQPRPAASAGAAKTPMRARSEAKIISGITAKGSCTDRITWLRISSCAVPDAP